MTGLLHLNACSAWRRAQDLAITRSAPKLLARQRRALGKRLELSPGDHGMNPAAKTAIGRSDDPLAADTFGEAQNALRDQLGMLDDIGRVAHDARQNDLAVGKFDLLPHGPFVLVADVPGFEGIRL